MIQYVFGAIHATRPLFGTKRIYNYKLCMFIYTDAECNIVKGDFILMEKVKKFVESNLFQNFILAIIVLNAAIMGVLTVQSLPPAVHQMLINLDTACLWIFVVELLLRLVVYRFGFFRSGWNLFDLVVVILSIFSEFSFFAVFRIFRIFRVLRSLKTLKSIRAFRLVSDLKNLRIIVEAVGRSIPGVLWSGMLLLLVYYIFAIMGTTLFGLQFPEWFGTMGKSFYTLFQVMTLESWSMGISRPVMEVFSWAWLYFVPFVLCTSFLIMNVVVGIVVNAISEVSEGQAKEEKENDSQADGEKETFEDVQAQLRREVEALQRQLTHMEELLDRQEMQKK